MPGYVKTFRKLSTARAFQKEIKEDYGYTPSVYHYMGMKKFVVVKPRGLKKM